jgi:hypothetical protein
MARGREILHSLYTLVLFTHLLSALIRNRPPKFLAGRAFNAQEIQDIQGTVQVCGWSWSELVCTICEHLDWVTPTGRYKEKSCASALRRLEALGLVKLPARQETAEEQLRVRVAPVVEAAGQDRPDPVFARDVQWILVRCRADSASAGLSLPDSFGVKENFKPCF